MTQKKSCLRFGPGTAVPCRHRLVHGAAEHQLVVVFDAGSVRHVRHILRHIRHTFRHDGLDGQVSRL